MCNRADRPGVAETGDESPVQQLQDTCRPQIIGPPGPTCSRSLSFETVLVMKTTKDRLYRDAVAVRNPMAGRHRCEVWCVREARSEARVWTPAIVRCNPLREDASEVSLVQRNQPVQAFAANRANQSFAERVRGR